MSRYSVVVQETVTYRVTVDAPDVIGAMQAARKARAKGKGKRTSKVPSQAMPSVTRLPDESAHMTIIPDEGTHTAVIGPTGAGKTFPGLECPLVGTCPKPCPNEARCGEVAAFKRAETVTGGQRV